MTGFNYLGRAPGAAFPSTLPTIAIDNRIRGPLAALLATIVLTALICVVELARLHAAQTAYATASARLAADEAAAAEVGALTQRIAVTGRLIERVRAIRRASLTHANDLTWIGNHLPPQTWLEALRYEAGSYSLEGTADRAPAVGSALLALHDPAHQMVPVLISLRDDGSAASRIRYSLRIQTQQ